MRLTELPYLCSSKIYRIMKPALWKYHLLAFVIVALWGTTFISTRILLDYGMTPKEIFLIRFLMAYVGIWLVSPRRLWCNNWRDEAWMLLAGMTGGSIYFLAENTAVGMTLVTNVSFIVCTAPLLTAILALWLEHRHPTRRLFGGSLLGLMGVAMVVYNGSFVLRIEPVGDLLSFSAAWMWAFYSLIINRVSGRYGTAFITRKVFFYGVLSILPFFVGSPWQFPLNQLLHPVVLGNVLFLGVVASLVCYVLWNVVLKRLGTVEASNYIYLNPVFTMICSYIVLGEQMTPMAMLGALLILGGLYWAGKGKE